MKNASTSEHSQIPKDNKLGGNGEKFEKGSVFLIFKEHLHS